MIHVIFMLCFSTANPLEWHRFEALRGLKFHQSPKTEYLPDHVARTVAKVCSSEVRWITLW